jgi:succinate dehydrogenase / fumarate reductase cytochrome b subunit
LSRAQVAPANPSRVIIAVVGAPILTAERNRPLSPHLQVYRLPLNAITSITHRLTGLLLALGLVGVVVLLVTAAAGSQAYAVAYDVLATWPAQLLLVLFTLALYYHLCAGVRHLFWDAGVGFSLRAARTGSWALIGAAIVLTVLTWALVYAGSGG